MPFQDQLAARISQLAVAAAGNRPKVLRYTFIAQVIAGLFLSLFGNYIGRDHLHLIQRGVRAQGMVVAYKQESMPDSGRSRWHTAYMPIVKFQAGNRTIQFKDWMGSKAEVKNVRVTVLYDPSNPSDAMIDRPVWNWIPWGPTLAAGLFLLLVGIKGLLFPPTVP